MASKKSFLALIFSSLLLISPLARGLENQNQSLKTELKTELQWALCETPQTLQEKLGLSLGLDSQDQIYFDTASYFLYKAGFVLYARQQTGSPVYEINLKQRFQKVEQIPADYLKNPDIKCEINQYQDREIVDCKSKSESSNAQVLQLSAIQKEMLSRKNIDISALPIKSYGVFHYIDLAELRLEDYKVSLDSIRAGDQHYIELSVKVKSDKKQKAQQQVQEFIRSRDLQLCLEQTDRVSKILEIPL